MTISLRRFLPPLLILLALAPVCAARKSAKDKYLLFAGTYTEKDSKGIYAYDFDAATKQFAALGLAAETPNPSFTAIDPTGRYLYAVNETNKYKGADSGSVSAFAIDRKTGKLSLLNDVASRGAGPCYVSFDKTGKYALVANYDSGNVAVFPVGADGHIGDASSFAQHSGSGPNKERQEAPHAHWIETSPDNRFALSVDLGTDEVVIDRFDANTGKLTANNPPYTKLDPGVGPRHLTFDPKGRYAYVINELQSSITTFSWDKEKGTLQKRNTLSALPPGFSGKNDAAEIMVHPNGKFLFASNRGEDAIVVFSIDRHNGALKVVGHFPTLGKTPRNFAIDPTGSLLLVANQESNDIVVLAIDRKSGQLTPTGQTLQIPSPVSLKFAAAN